MAEIEIDDEHWDAFQERAAEKGFDTTEAYVRDVLRQVYEKLQQQDDGGSTYTEEEEETVKDRLKNLGYMD